MNKKIEILLEDYGYDVSDEGLDEALRNATFDSVCPGICTVDGCDYTRDVEPDSVNGWCEECNKNTVASLLSLYGII